MPMPDRYVTDFGCRSCGLGRCGFTVVVMVLGVEVGGFAKLVGEVLCRLVGLHSQALRRAFFFVPALRPRPIFFASALRCLA